MNDSAVVLSQETRPLERHVLLWARAADIAHDGFSISRWEGLLTEIEVALTVTANESYRRGQIDQHDEPLPTDSIDRLRTMQP